MILALDFGGTKLTAGLFDSTQAKFAAVVRQFSPKDAEARYEYSQMNALVGQILDEHKIVPTAIGVSFGGPVDHDRGVVRLSHHVAGWENFQLAEMLKSRWNVPCTVDNDANAGALGEHRYGAGKGRNHICYLTVSTGVGGGWILNGQPWRGAGGMAGELGHTQIDPAGPKCLCGQRGCVERLASGPYMAADAESRLQHDPDASAILQRMVAQHGGLTGALVAEAASQGDSLAKTLLKRSAWAIGQAIGNAANLVNPELFVLAGGVTKSGPTYWDELRATAKAAALPEVEFEIRPADLGDEAPLWGAAALAESI
jgi:glucokinase